ncbi:MAG: hypothetical protein IKU61_04310 [Clostridia bacterium]|nr:hypothetical protein [Clostridia bacterium]
MSRRQILDRISELSARIDEENERKEELEYEIKRIDRAIERFNELVSDMEALLG